MCYGVFSKSFSGADNYRLRNYIIQRDVQIQYQLVVVFSDLRYDIAPATVNWPFLPFLLDFAGYYWGLGPCRSCISWLNWADSPLAMDRLVQPLPFIIFPI